MTAAAVLLFVSAGLGILAGFVVGVLFTLAEVPSEDRMLAFAVAGLALVIGVLSLVLGVFILKGRYWAWITAIVLSAVVIAFSLLDLITTISGDTAGGGGACTRLVTSIVVVALLSGERAREYFRALR